MNNNDEQEIEKILEMDRSSRRWKIVKAILAVMVVLLLIGAGTKLTYFKKRQSSIQYRTKEVTTGNLVITVTATGNLEPLNQVDVGVEVSGTIESINVDYNDHVKEGQVLARLDTTKFEAQVLQAKAAVNEAKAKIEKARANVKQAESKWDQMKRAKELSGGRVPSQAEMDRQEAAVESARADLAMAEAARAEAQALLRLKETDLSKAVIRSPINGIVLARHVEVGQTVAASLQTPVLFTLAEDLTKMELHVDIDEADVGKVRRGQKATFTVDAYPDRRFPATVKEVRFSPKTIEGVVTYETILEVENKDLSLRPGMTATADIVVKRIKRALLIPNAALRFRPPHKAGGVGKERRGLVSFLLPHIPKSYLQKERAVKTSTGERLVWVLKNGKPVPFKVRVGATNGIMTQVLGGGLKVGMKILTGMVVFKK